VRSPRTWVRLGLVATVLSASALIGSTGAQAVAPQIGPAQPVPTQAPPAAGTDPVTDYGSCLTTQRQGDLLVLVDESSSLQSTDPKGARVTAGQYLLQRLQSFTARSKVALSVSFAGFADKFDQTTPWTDLTDANLPGLKQGLDSFRQRNTGFETDYWNALEGARQQLSARPKNAEGAPRCQAIAWFTDGKLDISPRTSPDDKTKYGTTKPYAPGLQVTDDAAAAKAIEAATQSICRPKGLIDQLRSSNILTFSFGLSSAGTDNRDFDLLKSITTGVPFNGAPCGAQLTPTPGRFTLASNIDELLFALDGLSTPGQPPLESKRGICQGAPCEQDKHRFVLDASIKSVHILGQATVAGLDAQLVLPNGAVVPLSVKAVGQNTALTQDGVNISYSWQSERTVTIDLTNPVGAAPWTGAWAFVFSDPKASSPTGSSQSSIHISGGLFPSWTGPGTGVLHSGEKSKPGTLGVVDADRKPVDSVSILGTLSISAAVFGADNKQVPVVTDLDKTKMGTPVQLDLTTVPPGRATLRLTLKVTTAAAVANGVTEPGTELMPQVVDVPLDVAAPVGFPRVPSRVDFGKGDGAGTLKATLPVTGPGCVWVDGGGVDIKAKPDGVGDPTLSAPQASSSGACVKVDDGAQGSLPLELVTTTAANGTVNGTVKVSIAPKDEPGRATTVDVAFTAELTKPLNSTNFVLALLAALILGPGIPLALLYGAKKFAAKVPARSLSAQQIAVTVDSSQVLRDGAPFELRDTDLVDLVPIPPGGARRIAAAGVELRTRSGRSPFGSGFVTVELPGYLGASSEVPASYGKDVVARLPLAVHNHWAVLHDPTGAEDAAVLLLLVGGEASAEKRQDIVDDVNRRLPGLLSRLRADAASAGLVPPAGSGAPGPASPFDGGGAGPAGPSPFDFAGGGPQFPPAGGGQYQQQAPPPQQPQQYPPRPQQGPQQQHPPQQGPGPQPGFGYRDPRQPGGF